MAENTNLQYLRTALNKIQEKAPPQLPDSGDEILRQRQVKSVQEPFAHKPTEQEFFADAGKTPDCEYLKRHFLHEGRLTEGQALFILEETTRVLQQEPNLVQVNSPVTICGDIHGQFYDLMKLFEVGGHLPENSYLFLGDYVDRGCFGIECVLYLYSLKLWYPRHMFLLRGNHECRHLTEYFTFKRECLHKYSERVYEACITSFLTLPIAALVDGRFFCVHGGISPELHGLDDLFTLNRFQEPGSHGLLCDLLWSDPIANFGHEQEPSTLGPGLPRGTMFQPNGTRGCSYFFTYEAACAFLDRNRLLGIIRGHEAQDVGYTMHRKTPSKKFPSVITIFSAPNYLDVYHNRAAILKYSNRNITIRQFNASNHPYWLPNFMDAFTWSLPFVGAKIADMLLAVLSVCSQEELEGPASDDAAATAERKQRIRTKILAVGKMQRLFQILREEAEMASELAAKPDALGLAEEGQFIGGDVLGVQGNHIKRQIRSFDDARRFDIANERLPLYKPSQFPLVPVPSMRRPEFDMDALIRKTLEEDDEGSAVEKIAEIIARQRKLKGKPAPLKRHETA